jgi:hypothetical protein
MFGGGPGRSSKLPVGKRLQKCMKLHRSVVLASECCHVRAFWVT